MSTASKGPKNAGITGLIVGPLEVNCYLLWDKDTKDGVVIDPGGDASSVAAVVKSFNVNVKYILNTHGHFDHIGGDMEVSRTFGAPIAVHEEDETLFASASDMGTLYGCPVEEEPEAAIKFKHGHTFEVGKLKIDVIHTPGHTKGGACFYLKDENLLFTGDTLFAGGIGRTDFEGGSYEEIMDSIKNKIFPLGDDIIVLPGHGESSTIGKEKKDNPFLNGEEE